MGCCVGQAVYLRRQRNHQPHQSQQPQANIRRGSSRRTCILDRVRGVSWRSEVERSRNPHNGSQWGSTEVNMGTRQSGQMAAKVTIVATALCLLVAVSSCNDNVLELPGASGLPGVANPGPPPPANAGPPPPPNDGDVLPPGEPPPANPGPPPPVAGPPPICDFDAGGVRSDDRDC